MERGRRVVMLTLSSSVFVLALSYALTLIGGCGACSEEREEEGGGEMSADARAGQTIFETKCVSCHTVGQGDRIGPDLKDIHERREREWLTRWITDPINMSKNDPVGRQILAQYRNVPMPPPGLNEGEIGQVLAYIRHAGRNPAPAQQPQSIELASAEFDHAKQIYFERCAGCHGTLRAGATGPNIQPERTKQLGTEGIRAILTNGTPGGMPAWGRMGILSEQDIDVMARFIQNDPPDPPRRPIEDIRASWNLSVPVAERPTAPPAGRNWENYFGVVLRDAGKVAILDGDTHELRTVLDTGFAVHILRSSSTGRYFYAVGRDGRVTLIDLWYPEPRIVSQVQGCYDARSVDGSKVRGYEDRFIIEGCYWPPQYVVYDGLTLEPKTVIDVAGESIEGEQLEEVRVASIIASHHDPVWLLALKESGHVGVVDYSQENFPLVRRIAAERFLHDGGWDHTGRYFLVAANMRNSMAVIDVNEQRFVTKFETGNKPHPGRGANWRDPQFGWVNATTHIGEGRLAIYGADPQASPNNAWRVVRNIPLEHAGSLFVKTHPRSPWVWLDFTLSNDEAATRQVCVYSKQEGQIHRCWQVADHGRACHFEYNREGTEMWVSVWDRAGEIVIYDDRTLEERARITGDWLVTPTGKFNVYNTAHDVY